MDEKNEPQSKRPQDSDWKQQRLKAWQPLLTPPWVIGTFAAIAIVFIPIGIAIVVTSAQVVEVTQRYDNICGPPSLYPNVSYCNVNITIPEKMSSPVYVYYQLTNYFQNHRRYVKSRGDEQLRGDLSASVALCTPIETSVVGGVSKVIVPCGLIANSFFNDTITASYCTGSTCEKLAPSTSNPSEAEVNSYAQWKKTGIAWSTDVADKFIYKDPASVGATNQSVNGFPLPRVDDEDFIVWMRTAGLPTFRKLYRVINSKDLEAGSVMSLTIRNSYPVSSFSGSKSIILSTTSWLGGKNNFLGWCYIAVGALCAVLAIAFQIKQFVSPRRLGDMQYFHWSSAGNKQMDSDG